MTMAWIGNSPSYGKPTRKHDPRLLTDPDGVFRDFGYDIMRRAPDAEGHDVTAWLRRQLRMNTPGLVGAPLTHAVPREDFVEDIFLVPDICPSHLADAEAFWPTLQKDVLSPVQHLWGGPTFWFPEATSHHVPFRTVRRFIEDEIVQKLQTPAHLVAHDPIRVAGKGDYHVHVVISARAVGPRGLGKFVPAIVYRGCQRAMWRACSSFSAR